MAVAYLGGSPNTNIMTQTGVSPANTDFDIDAASDCALVMIPFDDALGMSVTAVTIGGVAATAAGATSVESTSACYASIYYLTTAGGLVNGTGKAVSVSIGGTIRDIYVNVVCFNGVDQTTPVRPGTYQAPANATAAGSYSMVISSDPNDITVTCVNGEGSGFGNPGQTNQTRDSNNFNGGFCGYSDHCTTPAASVTHTWTGSTGVLAIVGFSLQASQAIPATNIYLAKKSKYQNIRPRAFAPGLGR